jgi:hypothetical protein
MKGKILLVTGLAIGYVLGTRAGRERYEEIKAVASKFWNDPKVQKQVHTATDFAKDKGADIAELAADGAKRVVSKAAGRSTTTTAKKSSTTTSKSSTDQ